MLLGESHDLINRFVIIFTTVDFQVCAKGFETFLLSIKVVVYRKACNSFQLKHETIAAVGFINLVLWGELHTSEVITRLHCHCKVNVDGNI